MFSYRVHTLDEDMATKRSDPIDTVDARKKLTARRDPYWARIRTGLYIGFRKMHADSVGSWTARWRDPATEKQHRQTLGTFDHLSAGDRYDAAVRAANDWVAHFAQVGTTDVVTVKDACDAYIKHQFKRSKNAGDEAKQRLTRNVFTDTKFCNLELAKLAKHHVKGWRTRLEERPTPRGERAPSTTNRDMSDLRAALNLALADGHVTSAIAWQAPLTPIKNATKSRDVYLDRDQRARLIEAAPTDLAQFIRGMATLPLRPGALAALTVKDFDKRLGILTIGKDKANQDRKIKLPPSAIALMIEASRDKLPTAPLFTRAIGKAWGKDDWKYMFKKSAAAAKLPAATTMYALRHSTITDLVVAGVDLVTVATISGTSVAMIEKHYAHLQQDVAAAALERLAL